MTKDIGAMAPFGGTVEKLMFATRPTPDTLVISNIRTRRRAFDQARYPARGGADSPPRVSDTRCANGQLGVAVTAGHIDPQGYRGPPPTCPIHLSSAPSPSGRAKSWVSSSTRKRRFDMQERPQDCSGYLLAAHLGLRSTRFIRGQGSGRKCGVKQSDVVALPGQRNAR